MRKNTKKKQIVVVVSGSFDPMHVGHVRMFKQAKKLGDKLVVILNNDHWIRSVGKRRPPFMPEKERQEIIEAIGCVDKVILSSHKKNTKDYSVCEDLKKIKPDIFANGGDRTSSDPSKEALSENLICKKIGCEKVFNVGQGGKMQSSSWLLAKYFDFEKSKNPQK